MAQIHVEHLSKRYTVRQKCPGRLWREKKNVDALNDVSFDIEPGELIGYIGPNGAGKSTTVKILSGILTPDSGSVDIGGICPWRERKKHVRRIGVVFGQRTQLWWDVPVRDSYEMLKDIYSVKKKDYTERLEQLTNALELGPLLDMPLRMLSLGQRMRVELAGSLLHRPELLFLDEPTIGLDAVSKLAIRDFLKQENNQNGTTILLTTHDMEDISALCDRIMLLGKGRILYDGNLSSLLKTYDKTQVLTFRYESELSVPHLPDVCLVRKEGEGWEVRYPSEIIAVSDLLDRIQETGKIRELTVKSENVDTLVAAVYKEMGV